MRAKADEIAIQRQDHRRADPRHCAKQTPPQEENGKEPRDIEQRKGQWCRNLVKPIQHRVGGGGQEDFGGPLLVDYQRVFKSLDRLGSAQQDTCFIPLKLRIVELVDAVGSPPPGQG